MRRIMNKKCFEFYGSLRLNEKRAVYLPPFIMPYNARKYYR